jgi:DNA-binding transcriptional LysR family regulator
MDTIQSLRVFREIVVAGSFAAAAQRLDMSAPMVSKHLANLEKQLGTRLLHRSSRRLSLTELGQTYFDYCLQALDTLERGQQALSGSGHQPQGALRGDGSGVVCKSQSGAVVARLPNTLSGSDSGHEPEQSQSGFGGGRF